MHAWMITSHRFRVDVTAYKCPEVNADLANLCLEKISLDDIDREKVHYIIFFIILGKTHSSPIQARFEHH